MRRKATPKSSAGDVRSTYNSHEVQPIFGSAQPGQFRAAGITTVPTSLEPVLQLIRSSRVVGKSQGDVEESTKLFGVLKRRFTGHEAHFIIKSIEDMAGANVIANSLGELKGLRTELRAQTAKYNLLLWMAGGIGLLLLAIPLLDLAVGPGRSTNWPLIGNTQRTSACQVFS